ncbi:hypothetical protein H4582DRAFT_1894579 [Lactarius indigo]|nr:hypothetical protein H4582DRAFT_1894579 [Lactarius indigo]
MTERWVADVDSNFASQVVFSLLPILFVIPLITSTGLANPSTFTFTNIYQVLNNFGRRVFETSGDALNHWRVEVVLSVHVRYFPRRSNCAPESSIQHHRSEVERMVGNASIRHLRRNVCGEEGEFGSGSARCHEA